jgi:hypothetical protein
LHRFYEWDDRKAAEKWRIEQAKYHLRVILCIVEIPDSKGRPESTPIRKFFNVTVHGGERDEQEDERGYVTIEQVRKTPDFLNEVIEDAERQLLGWRERHRVYLSLRKFRERFSGVTVEIDRLKKSNPR